MSDRSFSLLRLGMGEQAHARAGSLEETRSKTRKSRSARLMPSKSIPRIRSARARRTCYHEAHRFSPLRLSMDCSLSADHFAGDGQR